MPHVPRIPGRHHTGLHNLYIVILKGLIFHVFSWPLFQYPTYGGHPHMQTRPGQDLGNLRFPHTREERLELANDGPYEVRKPVHGLKELNQSRLEKRYARFSKPFRS